MESPRKLWSNDTKHISDDMETQQQNIGAEIIVVIVAITVAAAVSKPFTLSAEQLIPKRAMLRGCVLRRRSAASTGQSKEYR